MKTLEEAIERFSGSCMFITNQKEECEQLAVWLRELKERREEPKIIRCGECEHSRDWGCELYCTKWVRYTSHDGYCYRGAERRIDDLQHKTEQD